MRKKERNTRHKLIEEFTCWHQIQQPKKRNQKGWSFFHVPNPPPPTFSKKQLIQKQPKSTAHVPFFLQHLHTCSQQTMKTAKNHEAILQNEWKPRNTSSKRKKMRKKKNSSNRCNACTLSFHRVQVLQNLSFCLCRLRNPHATNAHTRTTSQNTKKEIPKPKKKTTLPAGKNTPNTSSTRTTPPSVSRGRISVETPTLDTGPFTLPLFWGREQAERPAAWIWNGTTSKHTWLSPFCLLGVRVSFSQNKKKRTLTPFITSYVHSAQDELHQTTTSLTTVFSTFKNTLSHCFQYD